MSILVCASEVGSVRALIPVCHELLLRGQSLSIDQHGYFTRIRDNALITRIVDPGTTHSRIIDFLQQQPIRCVLFSVNVHDTRPLQLARAAQAAGIATVHVLDYWNGYSERMQLDGLPRFQPDYYLVPDDYAASEAVRHGIDADTIVVTGQPALGETLDAYRQAAEQPCPIEHLPPPGNRLIMFASEPVSHDQGNSVAQNPAYRGYTENDALAILQQALAQSRHSFSVAILPHPRQDAELLASTWAALHGKRFGNVVNHIRGRELLPFTVGIAGMASTLLYEAWLLGKPVLSLQPGLRNDALRMMQGKADVMFIDQYEMADRNAIKWLSQLPDSPRTNVRADLERHRHAATAIADLILDTTH